MTSLAGGNVPVAIFNATLSSLIGVFVTPLYMAWFASATGYGFPLGTVILKVALLILQLGRRGTRAGCGWWIASSSSASSTGRSAIR